MIFLGLLFTPLAVATAAPVRSRGETLVVD
jgi:hypothetical protein